MKVNTHVKSWAIANTRSNDGIAKAVASMLRVGVVKLLRFGVIRNCSALINQICT